jgi:homospermidine synthase
MQILIYPYGEALNIHKKEKIVKNVLVVLCMCHYFLLLYSSFFLGATFNKFSDWVLWDNRTGLFYETWTVKDKPGMFIFEKMCVVHTGGS